MMEYWRALAICSGVLNVVWMVLYFWPRWRAR